MQHILCHGGLTPDLYLDFCSSTVLYALEVELLKVRRGNAFRHVRETAIDDDGRRHCEGRFVRRARESVDSREALGAKDFDIVFGGYGFLRCCGMLDDFSCSR